MMYIRTDPYAGFHLLLALGPVNEGDFRTVCGRRLWQVGAAKHADITYTVNLAYLSIVVCTECWNKWMIDYRLEDRSLAPKGIVGFKDGLINDKDR